MTQNTAVQSLPARIGLGKMMDKDVRIGSALEFRLRKHTSFHPGSERSVPSKIDGYEAKSTMLDEPAFPMKGFVAGYQFGTYMHEDFIVLSSRPTISADKSDSPRDVVYVMTNCIYDYKVLD